MSGEGSLALQVRRGVALTAVQQRGVSSSTLLLFAAIMFMVRAVSLMLGPLLVALADDFGTSIAVAGQLAAATFITWGITAPLVGPISDTYGRRPVLLIGVLLMALGVLGSGVAWSYGSLLALRLITGIGSAMILPTIMAALADNLPPEKVGKAVGFMTSSSWVGVAVGVPAIALLGYIGGWRLPFYIIGGLSLAVWVPLWLWLPSGQRRPSQRIDIFNRFKVIGRQSAPWYVLIANFTQQMALFGLMTYFAAHMMESYGWDEASTAPGLALLGVGAVIGVFRFPGRAAVTALFNALMGLPPVVAGLLIYLLLSRAGPLGQYGILYTPTAMVIAQSILVIPIITALTRQTIADLHVEYQEQLQSLGASRLRMVPTLLWDGRFSLLTAVLAGFGRASAEVGAVIIVGGNINHATRVMTTTIALETSKGNLAMALGLGLVLIGIVIAINGLVLLTRSMAARVEG